MPSDETAYCDCGGRGERIGFVQDPNEEDEWFVCSRCLKPTRTYLENAFQQALQS